MPAMRLAVLAVLLVLAGLALPAAAGARTVWLCKPGLKADPCYSRDCRVFAPVYRQITLQGLFSGGLTGAMVERAYADVRDAWREYIQRHNRGRGAGAAARRVRTGRPVFPSAPFAPGTVIGAATEAVGFPRPQASTAWLAFPGAYSARCSFERGTSALRITLRGGAPVLNFTPDAKWGLHLVDANIALGT